jgi:hypothetical protein
MHVTDPTYFVDKRRSTPHRGKETAGLRNCCPTRSVVCKNMSAACTRLRRKHHSRRSNDPFTATNSQATTWCTRHHTVQPACTTVVRTQCVQSSCAWQEVALEYRAQRWATGRRAAMPTSSQARQLSADTAYIATWDPVSGRQSHRSEFYYGLLQQSEFMRRWHAQLQGTKQEPARRTPHAARRVHGNFSVPTRCPDAAPRVSSVVTGRWARGCGNCNVWPILAVTFISAARKSVPSAGGDANPSTQATTSRGAPQHVDTNRRLSHQRSIRAHAGGRCCAASQRTLERERDGDWRWRGAGVCRLAWRTRAGGDWAARAGRPNGEGCRPLLWGLECSVSGERRALGAHDRLRSAAQAGGGEATGSAARQTAQA